ENIAGHNGVIMNAATARGMGIGDGDTVEVASHINKVQGRVVLRQGIRPDTLLMIGQFGHWKTPFAKDFDTPSMNALTPMDLDLTDATGSGADVVRVSIRRVGGPR
ncbi:MAG: molybdopterin oxidoreductase, partial [Magnetospirillum sp.]